MMKASIIVHNDSEINSVEFVKIAGIINSISDNSDIVDAHQFFEKNNAAQVSAYLFTTVPFWPDASIFLSLVGEGRAIAVLLNNNSIIITKDNGTVTMCYDSIGIKKAYLLKDEYNNDYGMAKVCGLLLNDQKISDLAEQIDIDDLFLFKMPQTIISKGKAEGAVGMLLKTFGNITFTIKTEDFEKTDIKKDDKLKVVFKKNGKIVYNQIMTYQPSFGYVEIGEPVIFNGSSGYMDIGLNQRSFIETCLPEILNSKDITEYKVVIERIGD